MPLNSVQLYVKGILDGLTLPGQNKPLIARVTPPITEKLDSPRCYVWSGRASGRRQTMPRGAGFHTIPWLVDVWLNYQTVPDNANPASGFIAAQSVDSQFPLVIDAVLNALWTTTMTTFITDSVTNVQSQILSIGETWSIDYPTEKTPASQRMLWYQCVITVDVIEVIQG